MAQLTGSAQAPSLPRREYNGNARQRFSAAAMEPLDYGRECELLLKRIAAVAG